MAGTGLVAQHAENGSIVAPSCARAAKDAAAAIRSIEELFGQASPTCERAREHKSEWALACGPQGAHAQSVSGGRAARLLPFAH